VKSEIDFKKGRTYTNSELKEKYLKNNAKQIKKITKNGEVNGE
jgi:hypothetical protein